MAFISHGGVPAAIVGEATWVSLEAFRNEVPSAELWNIRNHSLPSETDGGGLLPKIRSWAILALVGARLSDELEPGLQMGRSFEGLGALVGLPLRRGSALSTTRTSLLPGPKATQVQMIGQCILFLSLACGTKNESPTYLETSAL